MKKGYTFRSFLCLLLAAGMFVSLLAVPASADKGDGDPGYRQFRSMLTLGTSMIRGYGVGAYDDYDLSTIHGFEGNAPYYVGQAVGANFEETYLAASAGETVTMPLWLLGLADPTEDYLYNVDSYHRNARYNSRLLPYFGKDIGGGDQAYSFSELIGNTELILIELGLGETVFTAKEVAMAELDSEDGSVLSAAGLLIERLFDGFAYFQSRFPVLLDYIKENNPNAEVVLVGCANPAGGLSITDEDFLPVGSALNVLFDSLNAYIKQEADIYDYKYADISDAEMRATEAELSVTNEEFLSRLDYYLHPSDEGIQYMTRQILNQLKAEPLSDQIRIDLGAVKSVKSVLADEKAVKDYSFDPQTHTLTLPKRLNKAKSVLVTAEGMNGKTHLATYLIDHDKDGASTYRLYSTVDAERTVSNAVNQVFSVVKTVGNALKGLFCK